jgi:peptidoglycan/xylan/chitin deacetylase (PgdA/CDA1 family)
MCHLKSSSSWLAELRTRFFAHFALKAVVIPVFISLFFVGYFDLLRHPHRAVTTMPLLAVDHWVTVHPIAMLPYLSLWCYVVAGAGLVRGQREMGVYALAIGLISSVGFALFFFWPTTVPPTGIDWAQYPGMGILKSVDASGNACPSLHVAFAVFTAIWLERLMRGIGAPPMARVVNALWGIAIAYSTFATKQHVAVDALAGATLGAVAGLLNPSPPGVALGTPHSRLNRQTLAFGISLAAKAIILAVGVEPMGSAAAAFLFLGPDLWIVIGLIVPNQSQLIPTATRFAATRREVWLTIDDGPEPATCSAMLDLLDRHRAKATFFAIGRKAAVHPQLVAEIRRRGHTLGNHTHTHPLATFWLAGPWRTARELDRCDAVLGRDGSPPAAWFRAPAGIKTLFIRQHLAARRQMLIGWSARGYESVTTSTTRPLRSLTRNLAPGAILVVHESATRAAQRIALLAALLEHLSAAGYSCVLPRREDLR